MLQLPLIVLIACVSLIYGQQVQQPAVQVNQPKTPAEMTQALTDELRKAAAKEASKIKPEPFTSVTGEASTAGPDDFMKSFELQIEICTPEFTSVFTNAAKGTLPGWNKKMDPNTKVKIVQQGLAGKWDECGRDFFRVLSPESEQLKAQAKNHEQEGQEQVNAVKRSWISNLFGGAGRAVTGTADNAVSSVGDDASRALAGAAAKTGGKLANELGDNAADVTNAAANSAKAAARAEGEAADAAVAATLRKQKILGDTFLKKSAATKEADQEMRAAEALLEQAKKSSNPADELTAKAKLDEAQAKLVAAASDQKIAMESMEALTSATRAARSVKNPAGESVDDAVPGSVPVAGTNAVSGDAIDSASKAAAANAAATAEKQASDEAAAALKKVQVDYLTDRVAKTVAAKKAAQEELKEAQRILRQTIKTGTQQDKVTASIEVHGAKRNLRISQAGVIAAKENLRMASMSSNMILRFFQKRSTHIAIAVIGSAALIGFMTMFVMDNISGGGASEVDESMDAEQEMMFDEALDDEMEPDIVESSISPSLEDEAEDFDFDTPVLPPASSGIAWAGWVMPDFTEELTFDE